MPSFSRRSVFAVALAAQALLLIAAAAAQWAPGASRRLVAVYPPWWAQERALAAAGDIGSLAGVGGLGFAVGLSTDRPDGPQALRRGGALIVVDGAAFPACFSPRRFAR